MEIELPPWKIFSKAISLIWEKRLFDLYISFPIILFYTLTGVGMDLGIIEKQSIESLQEEARRSLQEKTDQKFSLSEFLQGLSVSVLMSFLLAVIAVYWHRSILLGEHTIGRFPLRFDRVVWRYILYAIGMILLTMLIGSLAGLVIAVAGVLLSTMGDAGKAVGGIGIVIILFPLFIYLGIVMFRLSLVLPAAAIGFPNFGFRAAWRLSRGHNLAILAIFILMIALGLVILIVLGAAFSMFGLQALAFYTSLPKSLTLMLEAVLYAAQTLISIGVLSLTFAYLTYEGPRGGAVTRK